MGRRRVWRDIALNGVAASSVWPQNLRARMLTALGVDAPRARISPGCWFGGTDVRIGDATFVNYGVIFDNAARITIGNCCDVGLGVLFGTSDHELGTHERRAGRARGGAIFVSDGCWIGSRACLLPGVTVGRGTVIGAGSVVTSDCEQDSIYAGVPARRIRGL